MLVYAKEQKKGSMFGPSKKRGRDYPNEATPVQKFKKALLSNVESDPELNKWIIQNKGCLKCRRLNTNHFARECYWDLSKGYPSNVCHKAGELP